MSVTKKLLRDAREYNYVIQPERDSRGLFVFEKEFSDYDVAFRIDKVHTAAHLQCYCVSYRFPGYHPSGWMKLLFYGNKKQEDTFADSPSLSSSSSSCSCSSSSSSSESSERQETKPDTSVVVPLVKISERFAKSSREAAQNQFLIPSAVFDYFDEFVFRIMLEYDVENKFKVSKLDNSAKSFPRERRDVRLEFKCVDGNRIYCVHKHVLQSRSCVFEKMFNATTNMCEAHSNAVVIGTTRCALDHYVVEAFLTLLYCPSIYYWNRSSVKSILKEVYDVSSAGNIDDDDDNGKNAQEATTETKKVKENGSSSHCDAPTPTDTEKEKEKKAVFIDSVVYSDIFGDDGAEKYGYLCDGIDEQFTFALLELCHRFQLDDVVAKLEKQLVCTLSTHNVAHYYDAAIYYHLPHLLFACADFTQQLMRNLIEKERTTHVAVHNNTREYDFHESLAAVVRVLTPEGLKMNRDEKHARNEENGDDDDDENGDGDDENGEEKEEQQRQPPMPARKKMKC